jgi:hypothetical protein
MAGAAKDYSYENNQQDALYRLIFYSKPALRVSGVPTHPRHQPAATWVNTTRYCKYNQVLLMMGENIARNM